MPKTKRAPSKRKTSSQRHKIERKKREHKRDLRKAAKAMKASGLGPKRSKRSREMAKLALKVSNSHPDKEQVLERILKARETHRIVAAERRRGGASGMTGDEIAPSSAAAPPPTAAASNARSILYIPASKSNNFLFQFRKSLEEMVYPIATLSGNGEGEDNNGSGSALPQAEMPTCVYLITVDCRCAVQTAPWSLIDAIVARGAEYHAATPQPRGGKRAREDNEPTMKKRLLLQFVLTKADLVSAAAITSQIALLAVAIRQRYFGNTALSGSSAATAPTKSAAPKRADASVPSESVALPGGIVFCICPCSTQFDKCQKHVLKIVRRFAAQGKPNTGSTSDKKSEDGPAQHNMQDKVCAFIIGLPGTGRRTLARSLLGTGTGSGVAIVPLRTAQVQLVRSRERPDDVITRFVLPSSQSVTLVPFPEDARQKAASQGSIASGDVLLHSANAVDKLAEPETVAMMLLQSVVQPGDIAQAYALQDFHVSGDDAIRSMSTFLKGIGHTVRREGGFYASPLFIPGAAVAGQIAATALTASTGFTSREQSNRFTLMDSTYSAARPMKLVRVSTITNARSNFSKGKRPVAQKRDGHNALRIGARTFLHEFVQSRNVPWAILRAAQPLSVDEVATSMRVFNLPLFSAAPSDATFSSPKEYMDSWMDAVSACLKDVLALLPSGVVEFAPTAVVPLLHSLDDSEPDDESDDSSEEGAEEEMEEEEEGTDEEEEDGNEEDDDESDDE